MLPKIDRPKYKTYIPSSGKDIWFHPYTNKEEKILLHLKENEKRNTDEILSALIDLLDSCFINLNAKELKSFDLEFLFLQLRAKSVSEITTISVVCLNEIDDVCKKYGDPETREPSTIQIPLNTVSIDGDPTKTESISIGESDGNEIFIKLKYPSIQDMINIENADKADKDYIAIFNCIDSIYDTNTVYDHKNISLNDFKKWFDDLPTTVKTISVLFFSAVPKVTQSVKYTCQTCGRELDYKIKGLENFFSQG